MQPQTPSILLIVTLQHFKPDFQIFQMSQPSIQFVYRFTQFSINHKTN